MLPRLYIFTGPPGAGKTTLISQMYPDLPVYDTDLGNKEDWQIANPRVDACFCASAPSYKNKLYWTSLAKLKGYQPILYVVWVSRWTSYNRMKARSGLKATERNDLERNVDIWYRKYQPYPQEHRIDNEQAATENRILN